MANLRKILSDMVGLGNEIALHNADQPAETISSTVRFSGDLKRFLEAQAEAQGGVSVQTVITQALNGVMYETLKITRPDPIDPVDIIPQRTLKLFDIHGIDRLVAAQILGVPFPDMKPERLVNHVNDALLDRLAETFSVERRWLLGHTTGPGTKVVDWNLSHARVAIRLLKHARAGLAPKLHFIKAKGWDLEKSKAADATRGDNNIALVIELTRDAVPGDYKSPKYKTYEYYGDAPWDYQKTRIYLLSLLIFCKRMGGYKHRMVAESKGLDVNYFLHWQEFSWGDSQVDEVALYKLRYYQIMPSQILQNFAITQMNADIETYSGYAMAFIEDFVDTPEESAVSKLDSTEYKYALSDYEDMLKGLIRDVSFWNKADQEKEGESDEPDDNAGTTQAEQE